MPMYSVYSQQARCPECGKTVYVNGSDGICCAEQITCWDCKRKRPESEAMKKFRKEMDEKRARR